MRSVSGASVIRRTRGLRPVLTCRAEADASPEPPPTKAHTGNDTVFVDRKLHVLRATRNEPALGLRPGRNRDLVESHCQEHTPRDRVKKPVWGKGWRLPFAKMALARCRLFRCHLPRPSRRYSPSR